MDLDDEPPSLIDVCDIALEAPSTTNMVATQMQELGLVRVPITIVTGRSEETP